MSFLASLYRRFAHLVHELAKFGSIGAIAFVITLVGANVLHQGLKVGPLTSNAIATVLATTFAYFANRYWTFRHRDRTGLGREYLLFFGLNGVGLVITQLVIGCTFYVFDLKGAIFYNASLIIGTGVATLFRFWSYKKWVFLPVVEAVGDTPVGRTAEPPTGASPFATPVNGTAAPAHGHPRLPGRHARLGGMSGGEPRSRAEGHADFRQAQLR